MSRARATKRVPGVWRSSLLGIQLLLFLIGDRSGGLHERRIGGGVSRGSKDVCDHSVREEISAVPRPSSQEDPLFLFFFSRSPLSSSFFPPPPPRRPFPWHGPPPSRESSPRLRQRHRLRYQKLKPAPTRSTTASFSWFYSHRIWYCSSSIARWIC